MIIRLAVLSSALTAVAGCQKHRCAEGLGKGICMRKDGEEVWYAECPPEASYCAIDYSGTLGRCSAYPILLQFNGMPCGRSLECLSKSCIEGKCAGLTESQRCRLTLDCAPGYRCVERICAALLPAGAEGCITSPDCEVHSACFESKCIPYFSLSFGEKTECNVHMTSLLCQSGRCADLHCISPLDTVTHYPTPCYDDYECEVSECVGLVIPANCICGISSSEQGHCKVRVTDDAVQEYLDLAEEWLSNRGIEKCHSAARYTFLCMKLYWSETKMKRLHWLSFIFKNSPFQDVESCPGNVLMESSISKATMF